MIYVKVIDSKLGYLALMKQLHRFTGIFVSVFVAAHLFNHCIAYLGIEEHQAVLNALRKIYKIPIIEISLIGSFLFQSITGIMLFKKLLRKSNKSSLDKVKMYSGLILGLFLIQHIGATIGARLYYEFDTNFYFAANVVLQKPLLYYFIPYYFLGIMAFAFHVASIHKEKISPIVGLNNAKVHFITIVFVFFVLAIFILYVFTGGVYDITIPEQYNVY